MCALPSLHALPIGVVTTRAQARAEQARAEQARAERERANEALDNSCPICLYPFVPEAPEGDPENTMVLPCRHRFHRKCLLRYCTATRGRGACPVCRREGVCDKFPANEMFERPSSNPLFLRPGDEVTVGTNYQDETLNWNTQHHIEFSSDMSAQQQDAWTRFFSFHIDSFNLETAFERVTGEEMPQLDEEHDEETLTREDMAPDSLGYRLGFDVEVSRQDLAEREVDDDEMDEDEMDDDDEFQPFQEVMIIRSSLWL